MNYTQRETPVISKALTKLLGTAISPAWDWRRFMTLLVQVRLFYPDYDWAEIGLCKCSAAESWAHGASYLFTSKQDKRNSQTSTNKESYCPYLYSAHSWRTKFGLRPHCKRQTPRAVGNSHQLHPGPGLQNHHRQRGPAGEQTSKFPKR